MPRTIRFHLDEHVHFAVAAGIRRLGIDVTTTRDAGLLNADDDVHLAFGLANGRAVFTNDDDFLRLHDQGINHAGIVFCHQKARSIGDIVRGLNFIWEILEPDEIRNRVEYL